MIDARQKEMSGRSRAAQRAIRREQIIESTIRSINKVGFAETTLATVAKEAGVSQAGVVFHFKTKNALLIETLRHLSDAYNESWSSALAAASDDPVQRICALVAADFRPSICNRRIISVWYAFWGEAKSRPTYMKICGASDKARADAMRVECARLIGGGAENEQEWSDTVDLIDGLINGMWLQLLLDYATFKRSDALRIMQSQLQRVFPDHADMIAHEFEKVKVRSA